MAAATADTDNGEGVMATHPAEREYQAAKAAYAKALARLKAAKQARPAQPIPTGSHEYKRQQHELIWQAYLDGQRDPAALAAQFGRRKAFIQGLIRERLYQRSYGPVTAKDAWTLDLDLAD